jgi:hypothetical protein
MGASGLANVGVARVLAGQGDDQRVQGVLQDMMIEREEGQRGSGLVCVSCARHGQSFAVSPLYSAPARTCTDAGDAGECDHHKFKVV